MRPVSYTHLDVYKRQVKNYVAAEDDIAVELPDYENLPRPLIEVFTLDSATCAACTYMKMCIRDRHSS